MEHITVGRKYNEGKVAFVECVKNGSLDNINIKDKCFLLIVLTKGKLEFKVGGDQIFLILKCITDALFQHLDLGICMCHGMDLLLQTGSF